MKIRVELDSNLEEAEIVIKAPRFDEQIERIQRSLEEVAKPSIIKAIYSLEKSFSGTSSIRFYDTHKQVHVSRHYFQFLKEKLGEMR